MQRSGIRPARGVLALALAGLTDCSHLTTATVRDARTKVDRVVRRPDGHHVALAVSATATGGLVVAADEQEMCRDEEHGTRTYVVKTITTKRSGVHPLADFGGGCGAVCLPLLLVVGPVLLVMQVAAALSPDSRVSVEATDDPPEPYVRWSGERYACGEARQRVPDLPLRLEFRRSADDCTRWSARTGEDGAAALVPLLDLSTAVILPCHGREQPGLLLVAAEAPPQEGHSAARRTFGEVAVPLPAAQAALLGMKPPEPASVAVPPPWEGRDVPAAKMTEAVERCAPRLDMACRDKLDDCLREAASRGDVEMARLSCQYAAPYCEPATGGFAGCLEEQLR